MIKFNATTHEKKTIRDIARRALKVIRVDDLDRETVEMDLTACHLNGNPLDLDRMLICDDFTLTHDVLGINRHLDRQTGKLKNLFSPRCSK